MAGIESRRQHCDFDRVPPSGGDAVLPYLHLHMAVSGPAARTAAREY